MKHQQAKHQTTSQLFGVFTNQLAFEQYLKDMGNEPTLTPEERRQLVALQQTHGLSMNYLMEESLFLNNAYEYN